MSDGRDLLATACAAAIPLQVGDRAMGLRSDPLHFAVDPAYSLSEIRIEVGYALMAFVAFFAWTRDEKRLRLSCVAVLAGFAVISGSALLAADFRKGEWPSDVYYGGVGSVSNYLVTVGPVLTLTVAHMVETAIDDAIDKRFPLPAGGLQLGIASDLLYCMFAASGVKGSVLEFLDRLERFIRSARPSHSTAGWRRPRGFRPRRDQRESEV